MRASSCEGSLPLPTSGALAARSRRGRAEAPPFPNDWGDLTARRPLRPGTRRTLPLADVPRDRRRRRVDTDRPESHRGAQVPAKLGVLPEELADLYPDHLRDRFSRRLGRAAALGAAAEAAGELPEELLELGAEMLGPAAVGESLGLLELRAEILDPGPVGAAGLLVGRLVEPLLFNGSNASEIITITANGLGFDLSRDRRHLWRRRHLWAEMGTIASAGARATISSAGRKATTR